MPSTSVAPDNLADTEDLLPLYTDEEARAFAKLAPTVVPKGQTAPRYKVLRAMTIDERRLRGRRMVGMMSVVFEVWQLSESFDISWMSGMDSHDHDTAIDRYVRPIYGVRVEPHPFLGPPEKPVARDGRPTSR